MKVNGRALRHMTWIAPHIWIGVQASIGGDSLIQVRLDVEQHEVSSFDDSRFLTFQSTLFILIKIYRRKK